MKNFLFPQKSLVLASTALTLVLAPNHALADTNYISRFDTAGEIDSWSFDFGSVTHTNSFDPANDGNTNAASGSMKIVMGFNTALGGENKGAYAYFFPSPIAGDAIYDLDSVHLDVKVDPSSALDTYGHSGLFGMAFSVGDSWTWTPVFSDEIGANYQVDDNGWRHFDHDIQSVLTSTDAVRKVTLQLWGGSAQNIDGTVTFWVDNFYYTTFSTNTNPPPTLTINRAVPGLNITASVTGTDDTARYQRQDIRTASGNYSWINSSNGPVTYSITITNFPSGPGAGFEARLLLVGNHAPPGNFADYNEANVIYMRLYNVGDHYDQELRYKVAAPASSIFNGTYLGTISGPSPIGTWGLTIAGTNVTMFGPSGSGSTNFGAEVLTAFNTSTYAYVGIIPNDLANIGQSVTFSAVSISGATTALDDHFVTSLNKWYTGVAQDATGVLRHPTNMFAKIFWPPSPSIPFTLHGTNVLAAAPAWPSANLTVSTVGTNKVAIVTNSPASARFFRLENP